MPDMAFLCIYISSAVVAADSGNRGEDMLLVLQV